MEGEEARAVLPGVGVDVEGGAGVGVEVETTPDMGLEAR